MLRLRFDRSGTHFLAAREACGRKQNQGDVASHGQQSKSNED